MPESDAVRKRLAREAERRRSAARLLAIAECGCRYAAGQLANGIGPAEARGVAGEMAAELSVVARELRRLTRMGPDERRAQARHLAALGWPTGRIAMQLGVCDRTVRYYVRGRASHSSISSSEAP